MLAGILLCVLILEGQAFLSARKGILPQTPENLMYSDVKSNSVTLEWVQPTAAHVQPDKKQDSVHSVDGTERMHVHAFIVEIAGKTVVRRPVLSKDALVGSSTQGSTQYRYTATGLLPGTWYTVRVAASGRDGIGNYSQPVKFAIPNQPNRAEMTVAIATIVVLVVAIGVVFVAIVIMLISAKCSPRMLTIYRNIAIGRSTGDSNTDPAKHDLHKFDDSTGHCAESAVWQIPGGWTNPVGGVLINAAYLQSDDEEQQTEESGAPSPQPSVLKEIPFEINTYQNQLYKFKVVHAKMTLEDSEERDEEEIKRTVPCVVREHQTLFVPCHYTSVN
jgi:flagellar basal body-associated protein FliL